MDNQINYYKILLGQQEVFAWNRLLGDVKRRVLSQTAAERPLALLHVHRAGSRLLPERLIELIRIPHESTCGARGVPFVISGVMQCAPEGTEIALR